jgi:secondary thiamine-phosphate synthase enzyme
MIELTVKSRRREEMIDITDRVHRVVAESDLNSGLVVCYVPHTTAAVTINENADPDVSRDIGLHLTRLVPAEGDYRHSEGNSDAHIKASLLGASETVLVTNGRLVLGRWQGIYFCEFDGPRNRRLLVRVIPSG